MQATLAFSARPLAVRRATAQTSRRNALVVRAQKKDATRYVDSMVINYLLVDHPNVYGSAGDSASMEACPFEIGLLTSPHVKARSNTMPQDRMHLVE
jgi:hypothetical protein